MTITGSCPTDSAKSFQAWMSSSKRVRGNREALVYNLAIDDGHGALGGRRFHPLIGERNDETYPWVTWIVFQRKRN